MPRPLISSAQAITLLTEQPKQIAKLTTNLSERKLKKAPEPGEWSCVELLAHLRTCADMWGQAIEKILAGEDMFSAMNPRT